MSSTKENTITVYIDNEEFCIECNKEIISNLKKLYICNSCARWCASRPGLISHQRACNLLDNVDHLIIYKNNNILVLKITSENNINIAQNVFRFGNLFIKSKIDDEANMNNFIYYLAVLCENGTKKFAGFFSRPKSSTQYNLSCLAVMPNVRRRGIGRLLVELAHAISQKKGEIKSYETPITTAAISLYIQYYCYEIIKYMEENQEKNRITLLEISEKLKIALKDVKQVFSYWKNIGVLSINASSRSVTANQCKQIMDKVNVKDPLIILHKNLINYNV